MPDQVIVGSPGRAWLLAALALGMSGLAAWVLTLPDVSLKGHIAGWIGAPGFFAAAVVGAINAVKPPKVTLAGAGFSVASPFGPPRTVPWADIEPLFIWSYRSTKMVAWRYLEGRRPPMNALQRLNRSFGVDGTLPGTLAMKADTLADLMNARRAQALGATA